MMRQKQKESIPIVHSIQCMLLLGLPLMVFCVGCKSSPEASQKIASKSPNVVHVLSEHVPGDVHTSPEKKPSAEERALEAVGQSCLADMQCPLYLRCVQSSCAVPAAMTGIHDEDTPQVSFRKTKAQGSGEIASFYVELATDNAQRSRGLMYRKRMKPNWGMLFVYDSDRPLSFWMKNTYIPLDMVFVDSRGFVLGVVEDAEPLTRSARTVGKPGRYVLELKSGKAAEAGIKAGLWMSLKNAPRTGYNPLY